MNRQSKVFIGAILLSVLLIIFLFLLLSLNINFVFAEHMANTSVGGIAYSFNQTVTNLYNISINNSGIGLDENITRVNITLWGNIKYTTGTNGTNAGHVTFSNTSTILSWLNETNYTINGSTLKYFWFNATADTPGVYDITITTINFTGAYSSNISVTINDTINPTITIVSPINTLYTVANVDFNISSDENLSSCKFTINNWSTNYTMTLNSSITGASFTNSSIPEGSYTAKFWCNDTAGNWNNTKSVDFSVDSDTINLKGIVLDVNGLPLNNTNISMLIRDDSWTQVWRNHTTTNVTGGFNMTLPGNTTYLYQLSMTHFNETYTDYVDWVGQALPAFPYSEFYSMPQINFYLQEAGTINLTVINATNVMTTFAYQIKDKKLGYPVSSCDTRSDNKETLCHVPRNRNYSIMVYPNAGGDSHFVPVSFDWNNFTHTTSYNITDNNGANHSYYNGTKVTLQKRFNATESFATIRGIINASTSGIYNWTEFRVVPILLEPGDMVFMTYGTLPFNASAWNGLQSDLYDISAGVYNITLPYSAAETVSYMLFATAKNGTVFYGGYKNITVSSALVEGFNFSMYGLTGLNSSIINMSDSLDGRHIVNTTKQTFNLVNSSNESLTQASAHVEIKVDYSNYGSKAFTFMEDISPSGAASFSLPLLNVTGVKEIQVFSMSQAPKRMGARTYSQILANPNITLKSMNFTEADGQAMNPNLMNFTIYKSNSSCDVPNPPGTCIISSFIPTMANLQANMLPLVVGGGKISPRITFNNISVHYVNVDMLASGPPDSSFDNELDTTSSSGNSFSSALKFGSSGPTVYDYVLVAVPYTEGDSASRTGLNETSEINISMPDFYDEEWNRIWSSANGTNATDLGLNNSHYSTYATQWQVLMTGTSCWNTSGLLSVNSSVPCHLQKVDNKIWVRLPHFSGTKPSLTGGRVVYVAPATTTPSTGGNDGVVSYWIMTYNPTLDQFTEGYTRELPVKNRIRVTVNSELHYIGVIEVSSTKAVINVSSTPQQATLSVGDLRRFDVDEDKYYDISVTLNSINSNKANLSVKSIHEVVTSETVKEEEEKETEATGEGTEAELEAKKQDMWNWIIIGIVAVIVIVVAVFYVIKKK